MRRPLVEHVAMHLRVPRGHAGFWQLIQRAAEQGTFTLADIVGATNVHEATVADYVKRLAKAGYLAVDHVEAVRGIRHGRYHYRLARTSRDAPRLARDGSAFPETATETLWRTMKMLKRFTVSALQEAASTELRAIPRPTVQRYVRHLAEVGVLARLKAGGGRGHEAEFHFVRNLGAEPPRILRTHLVFDPNSNTVLGQPEAKEVTP
ncbi:hypothetical protein [Chelatococcus sp. XZ-Ab1]|uniref:hypothetical protein n=1 Tax=Chelatococcus sp. XZ-Ab1 TaxID=3034027 RepID=UPI0023E3939A|nr:hypothetical protein [Chelatococcus sp. XZ-Ab1]